MDTPHHVMHDRAYGHCLRDGIGVEVTRREFTHERQPLIDDLLAEVAHVEQHAWSPPSCEHVAFALFLPECLAHAVARTELHGFQLRFTDGRLGTHAVILKEAAPVLVEE